MKKIYLLMFGILLGFLMTSNVFATSYQFSCGFSSREMYEKYKPTFDGPKVKGIEVLDYGYRSEIEFTFKRTGLYGVEIVDCHKAEGYEYNHKTKEVTTKWGKCDYDSYVFDWNGREGKDMTEATYCPDGISVDGNVVKSVDEKKSEYVYITGENYKTPKDKITSTKSFCIEFNNEADCSDSPDYACVWVAKDKYNFLGLKNGYCNTDNLVYVSCGDTFDIPIQVPVIVSFGVNLLKIAAPIILIVVSIIALLKATIASNEDEIKKAQKAIIRKIIAAVLVFFIISIVQFVVMKFADNVAASKRNGQTEAKNLSTCLSCFLNNDCEVNAYYKTNIAGTQTCTYFYDPENPVECD